MPLRRNEAALEKIMPYRYAQAAKLNRQPLAGTGECVDLVKQFVPGLKGVSTQSWRPGVEVLASGAVARGTAIATFFNGKFPHENIGQHAAMFLSYSGNGFWVIEQH